MIARPLIARSLAVALLLSGASLAGCGKTGELERPAPLFNAKARADYDAQKREAAEKRAAAARARAANQVSTPDDANAQPLTQAPYATPLPGQNNPFGQPPQGSLPNPGTASDR